MTSNVRSLHHGISTRLGCGRPPRSNRATFRTWLWPRGPPGAAVLSRAGLLSEAPVRWSACFSVGFFRSGSSQPFAASHSSSLSTCPAVSTAPPVIVRSSASISSLASLPIRIAASISPASTWIPRSFIAASSCQIVCSAALRWPTRRHTARSVRVSCLQYPPSRLMFSGSSCQ